jgi:hypothetical protein
MTITNDDALIAAQLRRCLHELEHNWCDLVNTLSNLVDLEPDADDFDPATSITHELITLRDQLTVELEQTASLRSLVTGLDRVRDVADALFEHLTSDEPEETWSQTRAGELLEELAVALHDTDRPDGSRLVRARMAGNTVQDLAAGISQELTSAWDAVSNNASLPSPTLDQAVVLQGTPPAAVTRLVSVNLTGTTAQTIDELTAAMQATTATLGPPTTVEPHTIDEARQQMIHDLHRALYGNSWPQPLSPAEVWDDLLQDVSRLMKNEAEFKADSILLNRVCFELFKALGEVPDGATEHWAPPITVILPRVCRLVRKSLTASAS